MAIVATVQTITGATPAVVESAVASFDGASVTVQNTGSVTVFVGGADMTVANSATHGFALAAGAGMDLDMASGDVLYACVASGSGQLSVFATKV